MKLGPWHRPVGAALIVILLAAGTVLWIAQSDWLRERVRNTILRQAAEATGGRVELKSFGFDWRTLDASFDGFAIHGTEPPGSQPLVSVDRATVRLRIVSMWRRDFDIDRVGVLRPKVHLIVDSDGGTNLPPPRQTIKTVAGEILNLKIGRFDVRDGAVTVESGGQTRVSPWSASGRNLAAQVSYDPKAARYEGRVSADPVRVLDRDIAISADVALERNRLAVAKALIKTREGEITLTNGHVNDFDHPVSTARFSGRAANIDFEGNVRFVSMSDYRVQGQARGSGLAYRNVRNISLVSGFEATPGKVLLTGAHVKALGGEVTANAEIDDFQTIRAKGKLEKFDLRQAAAIETSRPLPYDAIVAGTFEGSVRLGSMKPDVKAALDIAPAGAGPAARGQIGIHYDGARGLIELGQSSVRLPNSYIEVSGALGQRLNVKAESRDMNDLLPAIDILNGGKPLPFAFASGSFSGTITGPWTDPKIAGHIAAAGLEYEKQRIDSVEGDASLSASSAAASNATVRYSDLTIRGSGSIGLVDWKPGPASPVTANAEMRNGDISRILALAGHKEIEIGGSLAATARIGGTFEAPTVNAEVALNKGTIYSQPYDSITGRIQSLTRTTQTITGLFVSGPKRVNISGGFEHAGTQFPAGTLDFNLTSNTMPLNQIALVRARQPDIRGFTEFHADGSIRIEHDAKHEIQFSLLNLNADASANSVELEGRNLGDARFTARTQNGVMQARFDSNAAKAAIHGEGTVELAGDYPVDAKITFSKAGLNALAALAVTEGDAASLNFDGEMEGVAAIKGPALKPERLNAAIDVTRLEIHPLAGTDLAQTLPGFTLANAGPLRASVGRDRIGIENARLRGPETDLNVEGAIGLTAQTALDLRVRGTVNLALVKTFSKDVTSSGSLAVDATVRGDWKTPNVGGVATLRNGDFRFTDFANGLTNANGEIAFTGTRANIQSFHAESGGGKVDATGFASLTNGLLNFRVEARAQQVRLRYPEGVSSISDASFTLAGSSQRSEISGLITIHRVSINPKSDAAAILAATVEPIKTPNVRTGFFSNMNLDVRIATAPDVALQTNVAQSIEADANLTLRGTVTNPALLGRINVTQGELTFFGNRYTINQGTISFFNPSRIDPILDLDFETKARGVDVIITVSGPISKLKPTYRSDPPLQFSDIVALLATGRAPGDATLVGSSTGQSQSFQQLGASELLGQAIANPVAGRLQRFFGVSRIKIDPSLTGVTGSPEARLTIEQQVTPEILFTYITDVSSTSTQLFRAEWSFNRHWSAILTREENGYVGLDFAYKKRFK